MLAIIKKPDGSLTIEPLDEQPGDCAEVLEWNQATAEHDVRIVVLPHPLFQIS